MFHFIAVVWNALDPARTAVAEQLTGSIRRCRRAWDCQYDAPGMVVFSRTPNERVLHEYVLPSSAGVILGALFDKKADSPLSHESGFDSAAARRLVSSGGRALIENFWGAYVAFLRDGLNERSYIIRDCSGRLPCYRTLHRGVHLIFSDVQDLAPVDLAPFTLNLRYLASFIYSSQLQIRECGLREIAEVLAGECFELHRDHARQTPLWNPVEIFAARRIENHGLAKRLLSETTQRCIAGWAASYDRILHSLSGGFDSAVVLGCLSMCRRRPDITCINLFTEGTEDDERRFARMAAQRAGVRLLEIPYRRSAFDSRLLRETPKFAKPTVSNIVRMLQLDGVNDAAAMAGAEALWTGQGGDHLFWQVRESHSAADFVALRGLRMGLLRAVGDAARLARAPYMTALTSAIRIGRNSLLWNIEAADRLRPYFVADELLGADPRSYVQNPLMAASEQVPKGKRLQIYYLLQALNRHRPNPGAELAYEHHPLLSQPIIELCLQIPLYVLLRGGRQRALAREAFADRVPPQIIRREDKGNTWARNRTLIRGSEPFLRELLLDGVLAREGVLRRGALETYLVKDAPFRTEHFWPLLACISAEIWARSWARTARRVAA